MKRRLILAALLLLAGCSQPGPEVLRPYAADEEGLTLVYINPSLPKNQQEAQRLQVRVDKVMDGADGAIVVEKSFTVGVQLPFQSRFLLKKGGVGLLSPDGKAELRLLPEGFPGGVSSWVGPVATFRVVGRGAWTTAAKVLPSDRPWEGTWVEARSESGRVSRTLYLPGLGEVQSLERKPDGQWVTVNLLTQYGFTDLPMTPPNDKTAETKVSHHAAKSKSKH